MEKLDQRKTRSNNDQKTSRDEGKVAAGVLPEPKRQRLGKVDMKVAFSIFYTLLS
jgi:hypothetical protein